MNLIHVPLVVVVLDNDKQPFAVWEDFTSGNVTVPMGFATDFASIPRPLRSVLDSVGKHCKAALLHDWLYWTQTCKRADADYTFLNAMTELGVSWWKKWIMYLGVRAFGWIVWNSRKKKRGNT